MKSVRNIVAAIAAGSALALGAAAFAQDTPKPDAAKPQAKEHQHRGEHRHEGMRGMRGTRGGGCHQSGGGAEHDHSQEKGV